MTVSIIIPNYNGKNLLNKNLPKVIEAASRYKDGKVEIMVVDDASSDNSLETAKTFDIKVLSNDKNLGFSSTVNRGVRQAHGDIVVLLNTDVVPEKDFLEPLVKHFADQNIFAVGCMDKSIENGKTVLRGRGVGGWQRGLLVHKRGEVDKTNTLWVGGGSGAFRKSIWEKLGGLDKLYNPFYWEDIDLSYRALKSGFAIKFDPSSIIIHKHEEGAINSSYRQFEIKAIAYRNQFIFVWKNATDPILQMSHLIWLPYHFIKAFLRGDFAFFLGFFRAFIKLPNIILSSFKAQKLFVKSDKEVMKEFAP